MKSRIILLLTVLIFIETASDFQVAAQGIVRDTVIAHPGQDKELTCDVNGTEESTNWQINGSSTLISLSALFNGAVARHNRSGRNIVVKDIVMNDVRNGSLYQCVVVAAPTMLGNLIILYVAGVPAIVPGVRVDNNTINNNGNSVNLTLSWEEPFNNLNSIVNYTVLCSGYDACPPNSITTDNTTRSYTITNLTPLTSYIFSVVATNSIGSGDAGVVNITTPPGFVPNVSISCKPVNTSNICDVTWVRIIHEVVTGYQVRYYENVTNVNSSNDSLTFTAQPVPDENSSATVNATVAAISRFGVGPPSEANTIINAFMDDAVIIAGSDIVVTNISNGSNGTTNFEFSGVFNMMNAEFTVSPDEIEDPEVTIKNSNLTNAFNIIETPANINDATFVLPSEGVSDKFELTIISILFIDSRAYNIEVIAIPMEGTNIKRAANSEGVMNNRIIGMVKLNELDCKTKYIIRVGLISNNGILISPRLILGVLDPDCLSSGNTVDRQDTESDENLAVAVGTSVSVVSVYLLLASFVGACAAYLYVQNIICEKPTCNKTLMWILFIASLGLGFLFLAMYLCCCGREGVKPSEVEMKESTDLYASPTKKEDVVCKQQELYSYARTGPINVIVGGEKP